MGWRLKTAAAAALLTLTGCALDDTSSHGGATMLAFNGVVLLTPEPVYNGAWPVYFCDLVGTCPEIPIAGLPVDHECLGVEGDPVFEVCPVRGVQDATLARDPQTGVLWMAHTYSTLIFNGAPSRDAIANGHFTALAASRDDGATWTHQGFLSTGRPLQHPSKGAGVLAFEAPSLVAEPGGGWTMSYMRYFNKFEDVVIASKTASSPLYLGDAAERRDLAGWAGSRAWPTPDLTKLDPRLERCAVFTEPARVVDKGETYLIVECIEWDVRNDRRVHIGGGLHVFNEARRRDGEAVYRYVGALLTYAEARSIQGGADQTIATHPSLARGKDGALLLFVSIGDEAADPHFLGCHVFEIADLSQAKLTYAVDEKPIVRAEIRAPQNASGALGPGQCAYDASSVTGVVITHMSEDDSKDPLDLRISLRATGVHP